MELIRIFLIAALIALLIFLCPVLIEGIMIFLGIIYFPIFTLSLVFFYYHHIFFGIIALILALLSKYK